MNTQFKSKQKFSFKQVLLASFLAVSLPATMLAHAEHDGDKKEQYCERGGMVQHGLQQYSRGLDLSSAQEDQLFNLNYEQIPTVRNQHKQHQQIMTELRATAQADKFDDAKAQQLADKAAKLEKERVLARARLDAKVFALLTPEQRKKAREFKFEEHRFGKGEFQRDEEHDENSRPAHFKQRHHSIEHHFM